MNPEFAPPPHTFSGDNYTVMFLILGLLLAVSLICLFTFAAGRADRRKQIHLEEMRIDRDLRVAEIVSAGNARVAELEGESRKRVAELEAGGREASA